MEEEKKYSKMLIPSILSVSVLTIMAPTAVSPALAAIRDAFPHISETAAIRDAFPHISETQAKLVLTLPTLVMMPVGLYSARLTARIDKKKLLLTGMTLFLVFGVAGGFVNDFRLLLLSDIRSCGRVCKRFPVAAVDAVAFWGRLRDHDSFVYFAYFRFCSGYQQAQQAFRHTRLVQPIGRPAFHEFVGGVGKRFVAVFFFVLCFCGDIDCAYRTVHAFHSADGSEKGRCRREEAENEQEDIRFSVFRYDDIRLLFCDKY